MVNGCFQHEPPTLIFSSQFTSDSSTPHFSSHLTHIVHSAFFSVRADLNETSEETPNWSLSVFYIILFIRLTPIPAVIPNPKKWPVVWFPKLNPIRGLGLIKSENLTGTLRLFDWRINLATVVTEVARNLWSKQREIWQRTKFYYPLKGLPNIWQVIRICKYYISYYCIYLFYIYMVL